MPRLDPLFEFDAPQTFVDLTATSSPFPAGAHDPWFDQVHPQHSKSSADLARELAETVKRLEQKDKHKQQRQSLGKENRRPSGGWRDIIKARNKELQDQRRKKFPSLKESRELHEPFQHKRKSEEPQQPPRTHKRVKLSGRIPLKERADAGNRQEEVRMTKVEVKVVKPKRSKDMKNLHELMAKHNKKFKAVHTYEPPQHSVREVKQWERETKKSYYALSADERVQANEEIRIWKQTRAHARSH